MLFRRPKGRLVRSTCDSLATGLLLFFGFLGLSTPGKAGPFTDPGHPTTSMAAWATAVDEVILGPMDIAAPEMGNAASGSGTNVIGIATGNSADTISLGDGGSITVILDSGISDGAADDFAVYENGFFDLNGLFAELAYVEVSSNGVDFARFDSDAFNPTPLLPFDSLDPTDYHGLAGRHPAGLGTGFDLEDLDTDPLVVSGAVDLTDVRYVRVVDVIGNGSTVDGGGNPIYDPYATAFAAGGFDLEAVGVIHVPEPGILIGLLVGIFALGIAGSNSSRRSGNRSGRPILAASFSIATIATLAGPAGALTATFDDLGLGVDATLNGSTLSGGYTSGGVFFENNYSALFGSFTGFAASTTTDSTTPGFGNQFSNITGAGASGSAGFGVAYETARIILPSLQIVLGAEFTATTYSALSILNGDGFAKKFGGVSGDDPDFLRLNIEGFDDLGGSTGVVELMLADYRFGDNNLDFVLNQWVFQDLTALGLVKELAFGFESTDVSEFDGIEYINTPAYFAIDNLTTIPEPGTAVLLGLGLAWMARARREAR